MYIFYLAILLTVVLILMSVKKQDKEILLEKDSTIFIRGIAIIFIMFHHIVQHTNAIDSIVIHFNLIGYICVAMFFLLSGYGNAFSYRKNKDHAEKWILKRILRIYLTFWIIWIIDLIAVILVNGDEFSVSTLIKQATTMTFPYWINWYLKIQVIAYILFYIAYKLFKKNSDIVLVVLTIISVGVMYILGLDVYWWNTIMCFGFGSVLAERKDLVLKKIKSANKYILLAASLVAFVVLFILGINHCKITTISSIAFCVFVTLLVFAFKFKSKIINFIGNISLEIYLWHLVLLKLLFKDNKNIMNLNINLLLFFVLAIGLAYISNRLVKKIIK